MDRYDSWTVIQNPEFSNPDFSLIQGPINLLKKYSPIENGLPYKGRKFPAAVDMVALHTQVSDLVYE